MKVIYCIACWMVSSMAFSQPEDTSANIFMGKSGRRPEILSGGFIDIVQNGQMNTSARLFRLFIGEPGKFQLPIAVYSGVSANHFSDNLGSEGILLALINPGNGVFNMTMDGNVNLVGNKQKLTGLQMQYQMGLRALSVFNESRFTNYTFFNTVSGIGLTFLTGAWERNKTNNVGTFWLNLRALYSKSDLSILKQFFNVPLSADLFGYSVGLGIEISQALNVKVFYFHYLVNESVPAFTQPFVQLTFNYSVR